MVYFVGRFSFNVIPSEDQDREVLFRKTHCSVDDGPAFLVLNFNVALARSFLMSPCGLAANTVIIGDRKVERPFEFPFCKVNPCESLHWRSNLNAAVKIPIEPFLVAMELGGKLNDASSKGNVIVSFESALTLTAISIISSGIRSRLELELRISASRRLRVPSNWRRSV